MRLYGTTSKVARPPAVVTAPATVVLAAPRLVAGVTAVSAQPVACAVVVPSVAVLSTQLVSNSGAGRPSWPGVTTWVTTWTPPPGDQPVGSGPSQVRRSPSSQRPAGRPSTSLAGSPAPSAKLIRRLPEPSNGVPGVKVSQVGSPFSRYWKVRTMPGGFHASSWMVCGNSQL